MRLALCLIVAAAALPTLASAQSSESERRSACTGDAFRLCATDIPDRQRIRRCLTTNRDRLSPDCRTVIDGGRPARSGKG